VTKNNAKGNQLISKFIIEGLHGYKRVEISFSTPYMVLLAENGQGKTTILNLLYACLYGDTKKLNRIQFDRATLIFDNAAPVVTVKNDLPPDVEMSSIGGGRALGYLKRQHTKAELEFVLSRTNEGVPHEEIARLFTRNFGKTIVKAALRDLANELKPSREYNNVSVFDLAREAFKSKPLYLPTFRRIEEDLARLGIENAEIGEGGINFGIHDVQQRLNEIQKEVLLSSNEWFSKINGEILSKLVNGFALDESDEKRVASLEKIDVVLERIGKNIGLDDKEEIKRIFRSRELFAESKYQPLVYFLSNMVKVYEKQKVNDVAVKEFAQQCQKYLVEKQIDYNESTLSVTVTNATTHEPVSLDQFSSGEKQIASLFAKLYLGEKIETANSSDGASFRSSEKLAIFYDEPELSLSVEWQEMLLPDIIDSGRCAFLFAVTHSPFILKNVKQYARDLTRFVTVEQ